MREDGEPDTGRLSDELAGSVPERDGDRALLERAAAAIGLHVYDWLPGRAGFAHGDSIRNRWNPLADDGDALRLAVRLGARLRCVDMDHAEVDMGGDTDSMFWQAATDANDAYAATRRAIVRAAASMTTKPANAE